ncbi:MAG: hypothetical protein MRY78_11305 [Saprospiraceae bacterium]|nr:hypothetical protein [Saprospiraceae bacterium]
MQYSALFIWALMMLAISTMQAQSQIEQSLVVSIQWWEGIPPDQVETAGEQPVNPVVVVRKSRNLVLSDRWKLAADIRLLKNTRPYISYRPEAYETFHSSIPMYARFMITQRFDINAGMYIGAFLNNRDLPEYIPLDLRVLEKLNVQFDGGIIAGIGYTLPSVGKLIARYNFGLRKIVPVGKDQRTTNQLLELGITINI